jgi:peptide/nickel transport system permease protein
MRLLHSLILLGLMALIIFGLIGLMPGDPVDLMISGNPHMTPEDAARLRAHYGLDQPLLSRFGHWVGDALRGELGYSRLFSQPVGDVILQRLPYTLLLMGSALLLAIMLAVPLGLLAVHRHGRWPDRLISVVCMAGISTPTFWLALLLLLLFSVQLGWLPANSSAIAESGSLADKARALIMPLLTLTLGLTASYTRYLRAALLEVTQQDFMRTARAKGLTRFAALTRHALRHGLLPLVTLVGIEFGSLLSGALITETLFSWPGMGRLIYEAIMGNDYNLALVALLLGVAMTLLGNALADVVARRLDPRMERV